MAIWSPVDQWAWEKVMPPIQGYWTKVREPVQVFQFVQLAPG